MLTDYGRIRKYVDGVEFEWHVEEKVFVITDQYGQTVMLPKKKIPMLQRFFVSVQHLPMTKLRKKESDEEGGENK